MGGNSQIFLRRILKIFVTSCLKSLRFLRLKKKFLKQIASKVVVNYNKIVK